MQINVTVDMKDTLRRLDALEADVTRAASAALNRVGTTVRAVAAREISQATGIKVSEVKDHVPLVKADRRNLVVTLSAKPWSPNLIRYQARPTKAGVSAKAWGQRKVYRGSFIGNKGRTVFTRVGASRLPLKALHGPSVPREFIRDHTLDAIKRTVGERFPIEFERAVKAFLERSRR